MTKQKEVKPRIQHDVDFFEVHVCRDKKLLPYLNIFHFVGANYSEQQLGELFGVIQVFDYSKPSEYLPNLLAQVIKKEFFASVDRTMEKSFEAALHKANLALVDLAQHEIIGWMGHLNAVIGVIQKNTFHFTQAGGGRILLIRNQLITEISRGLDDGEGVGHPIKTFSNTASGTLEHDDKVIFATETVFDAMSWEEMKRHVTTFSSHEFDNMYRSTLELEGDIIGTFVLNLHERQLIPASKPSLPSTHDQNFFGAQQDAVSIPPPSDVTVDKKGSAQDPPIVSEADVVQGALTPSTQLPPTQPALPHAVTPKPETGEEKHPTHHPTTEFPLSPFENEPEPYIKEGDPIIEAALSKEHLQQTVSKRWNILLDEGTSWIRKKRKWLKRSLDKNISLISQLFIKGKIRWYQWRTAKRRQDQRSAVKDIPPQRPPEETLAPATSASDANRKPFQPIWADFFSGYRHHGRTVLSILFSFIKKGKRTLRETLSGVSASRTPASPIEHQPFSTRTYFLVGLGILVMIIGGFLYWHHSPPTETKTSTISDTGPNLTDEQPNIPGTIPLEQLETVTAIEQPIRSMASIHEELFVLSESGMLFRVNQKSNQPKKVDLPDELRTVRQIAAMPQLQLLFLITPNDVFSFSPVTNRFDRNQIVLPPSFDPGPADCYLTYLYVYDKTSHQLYQYPRAAGGFGQSKLWFKKALADQQLGHMSIDGSVYAVTEDGILMKWFQGKPDQSYLLSEHPSSFRPTLVRSDEKTEQQFVLDSTSGYIIRKKHDGSPVAIWQHNTLRDVRDFWIDTQQKQLLFSTADQHIMKWKYD